MTRARQALWFLAGLVQAQTVEFNRDIRPILSDRCFTCHGPDAGNRKSKVRFDQEESARAVIVAGNPGKSSLYQRITSENKALRMPPAYAGQDKLKPAEIEKVRQWIEQGANWQNHWAFIVPRKRSAPEGPAAIDYLVRARLTQEGLQLSPEADPVTLLRRVTLDLTGLPPSPAEGAKFVADPSPQAYENAVDRLLASPRYAERMAFRWMEAARYADTNGYQSDGERDMWRWRDWVIEAFDRNMPFDQFTVEQIAGDLLPDATLSQRIASGFHRNHRTSAEGGIVDEEFRVEYVADRVETTATVWLGLTLGCARCHDHKYDPFPQRDFYRLFAFFNNVPEKGFVYNFGNEEPYLKAPSEEQAQRLAELNRAVDHAAERLRQADALSEKAQGRWEKGLRGKPPLNWNVNAGLVYHLGLKEPEEQNFDGKRAFESGEEGPRFNYQDPFTMAAWIRPESPNGAIVSKAEDYFEGTGHSLHLIEGRLRLHVVFRWTDLGMRLESADPLPMGRWQHVLVTYDGGMKASGVRMFVDGAPVPVRILFDQGIWPIETKQPWRVGAGGGLRFHGQIRDVRVYARAVTPEEAAVIPLAQTVTQLAAIDAKLRTPAQADKLRFYFLEQFAPRDVVDARAALAEISRQRDAFAATIPTSMVMSEHPTLRDAFVLKRGAYDNPGERVTAGVPAILPPLPEGAPVNRLGLARWLVSRDNPLTARVTVNRFWQMLFGVGLVKTVEDFGSQGEWPVHQDLLDWLAADFMENGWDVKRTMKSIVMSATYRQSSRVTSEMAQRDPENRLLARGPRIRVGPEMIRDQALMVSGLLVEKTGGPSVRPYQPPGLWQELQGGKGYVPDKGEGLYRRSLYTYWKRTVAPPFMVNFDSPNREVCVVREARTNTPLQALNLMNDIAFVEAARKLAERMMRDGGPSDQRRIEHGWRLVLGRAPSAMELPAAQALLDRSRNRYRRDEKAAAELLSQGDSPRDPALAAPDLAAYTMVASLLLNLDETVTKE